MRLCKAVGINLELESLDFNAAVEKVFVKKTFDLGMASYCNGPDPEIGVRRVYVSSNIAPLPFSNGASYKNPAIDALFDRAATLLEATRNRDYPLLLVILILTALGAERIAPDDPFAMSGDVLRPPSVTHPFGTDDLGRDLFSAVVHGVRSALLVGLGSACTATVVGGLIGGMAGYAGGLVDKGLMRLTELVQVVPRLFLALIVVALFGNSLWLMVLLLGGTYWPGTARLLRAQVLTLRTREYVLAARAAGARDTRIVLRHVLPGALPPVITQAALHVGGAILVEAGLSFVGVGDRHVVSWGALLNDAQQFVRQAWWMSAFPGLALTLTVLGSNLVADGLNDAWDPRLS